MRLDALQLPDAPRILLPRTDHLGDVLLALHAAPVLRARWPNARITALVSPATVEIPRHCSFIDETLAVAFPGPTASDDPPGWSETIEETVGELRGRFDLALLTRLDDPWSGALAAAAEIPRRVGYAHPRTLPFLTGAVPLPARQHAAQTAIDLARAVTGGLETSVDGPLITPSDAGLREARAIIARAGGTEDAARPVVIHPGAGWELKSWPVTRWGVLAHRLAEELGVTPLITGGADDVELADAIVRASRGSAVSVAGIVSLGGLIGLLGQARLVIANDGGPLHLAAALRTPVVGLYGPADPVEFGPRGTERQRVVQASLPCQPCRTLDSPPCGARRLPACLLAVSVETLLDAARELLAESAPSG